MKYTGRSHRGGGASLVHHLHPGQHTSSKAQPPASVVHVNEILEYLNGLGGAEEAAQVQTFEVWLHGARVRVEVHDRGPSAGSVRFTAYAWAPDVPEADRTMNAVGESLGNPDSEVRTALMNVHWGVFRGPRE